MVAVSCGKRAHTPKKRGDENNRQSYTVNGQSRRWSKTKKQNKNIIRCLLEQTQTLFKLISILLNDLVGDARIIALHRTLEHDFPFPHFKRSHATRSPIFFSDHYAFSALNNHTKILPNICHLIGPNVFWQSQYHIRLKSKPFCYHSRAYVINFFLDLLTFGIVVTLMIS